MKHMTIYTVSSTDDSDVSCERCTIGSYLTRGAAIRACADYILERMEIRDDINRAFWNNENDGYVTAKDEEKTPRKELRKYLIDRLGEDSCYWLLYGSDSFHFDIDENDLEGTLWVLVTEGDECGGPDNPEFEDPMPLLFTTKQAALVWAYHDYQVLSNDLCVVDGLETRVSMKKFMKTIREEGSITVDIDGGRTNSYHLWQNRRWEDKE